MNDRAFDPLTVWDNVDAAVQHIGLTQPGVVWGLANVRWNSVEERDQFLRAISKKGTSSA